MMVRLGACAVALALSGCGRSGQQLSFVGPQVEGVREFSLVSITGGERSELLADIGGLGSTLLWLPDGQRAVVYREDERDYYLADVEAGSLGDCLTCSLDGLSGPAISPDGTQIAWVGPDGIYLQKLPDGQPAKRADVARPGWITWSPDGDQLAFAARVESLQIYRMQVPGGEILQLTHSLGDPAQESFAPAWSPRGDVIAFHSLDADGLHLMQVGSDGSGLTKLADWAPGDEIYDPGLQAPPVWSPNGETLLFAAASALGDLEVFSINPDSGDGANLTEARGDDWDPAWSPDSELIAFVTNRDGDQEIYLMYADGRAQRNLSQRPTTPEMNPAWRP
jgi:Tol biopolymer transport system component